MSTMKVTVQIVHPTEGVEDVHTEIITVEDVPFEGNWFVSLANELQARAGQAESEEQPSIIVEK